MEVEMISASAHQDNEVQPVAQKSRRRRRSSTGSTSLSPAKENNISDLLCENIKTGRGRKRTKSSSSTKFCDKSTFWGWSPKKAKFKPKVMDESGELTDHPDPEAVANRSKWQPIVMQIFHFTNLLLAFHT